MWGEKFAVFGLEINTFRFFIFIAFAIGGAFFYSETKKIGLKYTQFFLIYLIVVVLAPIGASLLSVVEFGRRVEEVFEGSSGSTHLGGYFLTLPIVMLAARLWKIPILKLFDIVVLCWCLGYAFGRLACFFSGDGCYGIQTSSIFGMTFPHGIVASYVPVYPTPLLETVYSLVIFAVYYYFLRVKDAHGIPDGRIFFGASSWMFLCRFAVEFIRINPKYYGFTLTQWACMPLLLGYSFLNIRLPLNGNTVAVDQVGHT